MLGFPPELGFHRDDWGTLVTRPDPGLVSQGPSAVSTRAGVVAVLITDTDDAATSPALG